MAALPQLGLVGVIAVGGYLALHGSITIGTFLAFATYVATMTAVTRTLSSVVIMAQLSRAAVERVYEVIDAEPAVADPAASRRAARRSARRRPAGGHVRIRAGPSTSCAGSTCAIAPGETVAIVGTGRVRQDRLSLLLPRFYAPIRGSVSAHVGGRVVRRRRS